MSERKDPGGSTSGSDGGGESLFTVIVALLANALIAAAKTFAAVLSGSASMLAESAHSWADTGNEVFLLIAERRAARKPDSAHPLGYGRAAYIWAMVAGFGLLTAGSIVSIIHGIESLSDTKPDSDYLLSYIVLAISFVLEGVSFSQAVRQTRASARPLNLRPLRFVLSTSKTTLRAVFFEDATALIGLIIAASGLALHELTGNAVFDAIGSILVGVLVGLAAILLIVRNGQFLVGEGIQFLVGEGISQALRDEILSNLLAYPDVDRVTFLYAEYVGPDQVFVVASVDLVHDERESVLQGRLQAAEDALSADPRIVRVVLSLSAPGESAIAPTAI